MKYYKFTCYTPYVGTEIEDVYKFENDITTQELEEFANELSTNNAESYEYLVFGFDYDPVEEGELSQAEYETTIDEYYADCGCFYEEITKEEFDNF